MNPVLKYTLTAAALALATQAAAQVTFYENENFTGRSFVTQQQVRNFERFGFNDRASSVIVTANRWEVCDAARFEGRCVILRPGRYPSLASLGLNDRVSSIRTVSANARVEDSRYAPAPVVAHDYRRRNNERTYEANVTSVRAVVGTPEQRCWIEREQVSTDQGNAQVPGAIVGALLGGILGHQVGNGSGRDIATAGGAIGGAVIGANVAGRSGSQQYATRDVQRCTTAQNQRPDYYDVTYNFRGQDYRVQMTADPGRTVTVNGQGEPRA